MWRIIPLLILLTACGTRPLTEGERAFAATVHGPSLDVTRVRIVDRNPLHAFRNTRAPRPSLTCRERILPPETGPIETRVAATVLWNRAFFARPFYSEDFLPDYPRSMNLHAVMLLAHELTHVWQWQNAETTGYSPAKAAREHGPGLDPYLFEIGKNSRFSDYSYEQQGGLVEEFVCCRALDPDGPRSGQLHQLLLPVFPGLQRKSQVPIGNISTHVSPRMNDDIC